MNAELRQLFFDKVIAYAAAQSLPVAFPNVPFTPPQTSSDGNYYLRVSALPAEPEIVGVNNGESRYVWVLQVSIYARDGIGELSALRYAKDLRTDVFKVHEVLQGAEHAFKIIRPAAPREPIPMAGWYAVPVRLRIETIN